MTLQEAIEIRRSRRHYLAAPIDPAAVAKLRDLIAEYNQKAKLRLELVTGDGKAFNGFFKSYGMFSGVENYIGLIADSTDGTCEERLGYYGELLALHGTTMGLGSCFVGGSFKRSACPFVLAEHETIPCVIAIGKVEEPDSAKEKFIRNMTHRKIKSVEEMFVTDGPVPDWFMSGMKAVQKAPSAVNRQPVVFSFKDGMVTAGVSDITKPGIAIDLGIAKLHFELGAGDGTWEWGNGGRLLRNKSDG